MKTILETRDLKKYFPVRRGLLYKTVGYVKAVDGVSLDIEEGKTLGLVGESGSGKTTFGRMVLQLLEPDGGSVSFRGQELSGLRRAEMRELRRHMQIVFQDPFGALDPRFSVGKIIREGLEVFPDGRTKRQIESRVAELLDMVGLPRESVVRFPHEFSGGQRQRIGIARAIALNPSFLVLDEPVSSLDVSIQAQIINLLRDIQVKCSLTYLMITHDLRVVRHVSDTIAVMYRGRIVERGGSARLFTSPLHPYTTVLLDAIPVPDPAQRKVRRYVPSDAGLSAGKGTGCRFRASCDRAIPLCGEREPVLEEKSPGHYAACHRC